LKEKLIKISAKVVRHGRYVAFQMADFTEGVLALCRNGRLRQLMGSQNTNYIRTNLTWHHCR
jgi:hypothetical protein